MERRKRLIGECPISSRNEKNERGWKRIRSTKRKEEYDEDAFSDIDETSEIGKNDARPMSQLPNGREMFKSEDRHESTANSPARTVERQEIETMWRNILDELETEQCNRMDARAATFICLEKEERDKLAGRVDKDLSKRHKNATAGDLNEIVKKIGQISEDVRVACYGDDEDDDVDEEDGGGTGRRSDRITEWDDEWETDGNADCDPFGSEENKTVEFKGVHLPLRKSKRDYERFVESMKQKMMDIADDKNRRILMGSLREVSIYRMVLSMRYWLHFCVTHDKKADEVSPDLLIEFRDWLSRSKSAAKVVADKNRFKNTINARSLATMIGRVYGVFKLMGLVPAGKPLMRYLETSVVGEGFSRLFNKWLARQVGDCGPLARAEIMPADIDFFAENVDYSNDAEFQSVVYLYVMMATGCRTSSLIPTKDTKYSGLLVEDLEFTLLPDGRLTVDVAIRREKQSIGADDRRVAHIEDRRFGASVPMLLFCQLVLVGAFENEPEAILDFGNDLGLSRFHYKENMTKLTVFRHYNDASGRLTMHPMVNDYHVFRLYATVMGLPRRGFSSRSIRRGTAVSLIDEMVRKMGYFDRDVVIKKLMASGIWTSKTATRYVDTYAKGCFNMIPNLYGEEAVNPHGDRGVVSAFIPASYFRIPDEFLVNSKSSIVMKFVTSLQEIKLLDKEITEGEEELNRIKEAIKVKALPSIITSEMFKRAAAAGYTSEYIKKARNIVSNLKNRRYRLFHDRCHQYADHFNYKVLSERRKNRANAIPLQATRGMFDWRKLGGSFNVANRQFLLSKYAPYKGLSANEKAPVRCPKLNCPFVAKYSTDLEQHLLELHGILFGRNPYGKFKTVAQRLTVSHIDTKRSITDQAQASNSNPTELEKNDQSNTFICRSPMCKSTFSDFKSLLHHVECKHAKLYCKECKLSQDHPEFDQNDHDGHSFEPWRPKVDYRACWVDGCDECVELTRILGLPINICLAFNDKVQTALDEQYVKELCFVRYGAAPVSASSSMDCQYKRKRDILYGIVKFRLFGHDPAATLPKCVIKEIQRRYSDSSFNICSQEV